ncbi:hypothetical protein H2200_005819 [Cladophialophora chaetospira]|uniref:Uncharacterized protein n=1 Tax=Cladophialophora chaetospira TaxID=386627 RepID=A0AA39CIR6_9EURO|nr:hypothetical protein H2200_005819 [Cladophialophora chaetospira]
MSAQGECRDSTVDEPKSARRNFDGEYRHQQQTLTLPSLSLTELESPDSPASSHSSHSSEISDEEDQLTVQANQIRYDCMRLLPHIDALQTTTEKLKVLKIECEQLETQLKRMIGPIEDLGVPRELLRGVLEKFFIDIVQSSLEVSRDHVEPLRSVVDRTEWILEAAREERRGDWRSTCPMLSEAECEEAEELTMVVKAFEAEVDVLETSRELFRGARVALGWVEVE